MSESTSHETATAPAVAVSMRGIAKRFPGGVVANHDVDFDLAVGEIHALLGENGAGKSTLSNILTGIYQPDEGTIALYGEPVAIDSPGDAIERGIGMVHQHFRLVETMTVAENIVLGQHGPLRRKEIAAQVRELGERYGLPVDPNAKIWQLSVGEQQRVEILKALQHEAKILVLDEPTAVLTPPETDVLFATLRRMADEGRSIIFISHKLDEVMAVSDRVTVLRDGTTVGTVTVADTTSRELARLMVGRDVVFSTDDETERPVVDYDRCVLKVRDLRATDDRGGEALRGASLKVHAGEIVAVVGVAGNGQRELAEAISATRHRTGGAVVVDGVETVGRDPRELIKLGVSYVPEDRLHVGLAASRSIEDNLVLKSYRRPPVSRGPFVRRKVVRENAVTLMDRFGVKAPGPATSTRLLSGGNVQKVLLAREFTARPTVLIAASPTRGLDVGAIEIVRELLLDAARDGVGVLLMTEDLEEAIGMADRVLVMFEGRIIGEQRRGQTDVTSIGLMMGGKLDSHAEEAES